MNALRGWYLATGGKEWDRCPNIDLALGRGEPEDYSWRDHWLNSWWEIGCSVWHNRAEATP